MGETLIPQPSGMPDYRMPRITRTDHESETIKNAMLKRKRELALKTGEVLSSHTFQDEDREANNETILIDIEGFGKAVFKPKPENPEDHFDERAYLRERAAYLISEFFDLNVVPTTVIRELDGRVGCAQEFIPETENAFDYKNAKEAEDPNFKFKDEPLFQDDLNKIWILDLITLNSDRNYSNLLIEDGKLHAIDNGECFILGLLSYFSMYDKKVPTVIANKIREFCNSEERQKSLYVQMRDLLSPEESEQLFDRIFKINDAIQSKGTITETDFRLAA